MFHLSLEVCCKVRVASNLDVSKVDRVLHMLQCDPPAAAAGGGREGAGEAQTPCGFEQGADAV